MWFIMFLVIMSELPDKFKCICFCVCCLIQGYSNTLDYYRHQHMDNIIEMSTKVHNEILTKLTKGSDNVYKEIDEETSR